MNTQTLAGKTAKEINALLGAGEASKQDVMLHIEDRARAAKAKGHFVKYPSAKLYFELTGTKLPSKSHKDLPIPDSRKGSKAAAPVKAEKPAAKPATEGESRYEDKVRNMKDNALKFALTRAKDPAKVSVLEAEHARRNGEAVEPEEEVIVDKFEAAMVAQGVDMNDPAVKAILAAMAQIKH